MRLLVIGGTQFVGRHIVADALRRGHDVTLFHRGVTGPDLFPEAHHVLGDRNADLSPLGDGEWDATIDVCGYFPRQVRALAAALRGRGGRYVFISSISAYADPPAPGISEDAPLRVPADPDADVIEDADSYGGLKALCEAAAADHFDDPVVIRPSYVVGPHDHTGRFTYWVLRFARGGRILVPGPPDDPMQVIDARDMAAWIVTLAEQRASGTFHAASPAPPFSIAELFGEIAAEVAPDDCELVWMDAATLARHGVEDGTLPLWVGDDPQKWVLAVDPSRAVASGLEWRPLRRTIRETLQWARSEPSPVPPSVGLTPEREAELVAAAS